MTSFTLSTDDWLTRETQFAAFATGPLLDFWRLREEGEFSGGIYLCWMGWQLLRSARSQNAQSAPSPEVNVALPKPGRSFIRGFLTNLSNPKAVIYFGSVFSLFVGDDVGAGARWGLFLLIIAETFVWFSLVAVVFALPAMRRGYQRLAKWIDGLAGVLFTGFGLHLIFTR